MDKLDEFTEDYEAFVEEEEFLSGNDDDPDEYRKGYRAGYWDALVYVRDWLRELAGV